jgi:glycosyltransferase involved in cell wall biosynthesis
LRIALLTYRGKAHCGGQGVYTRYVARSLTDLGHHVEVFSGNPYPEIDDDIILHKLPSLNIWNDTYPGRMPAFWELKSKPDVAETLGHTIGTFSEPMSFSWRAYEALKDRLDDFDLIHDNQTLGYGILALQQAGLPVLETIHHPITVDRKLEIEHSRSLPEQFGKRRWYAFTKMQTRVARRMMRVMTVSESSLGDICNDHKVSPDRIHVVPVGVDPDLFKPLPEVKRVPGRIVTTASADVALKGLHYLLEALAKLRTENPEAHLVIIGKPKDGGRAMDTLARLGLEDHVEWISGVPDQRIVELYSECSVACVPSLYEGFSLPAIEAMSSAAPLVVTNGGALPEVVGEDGVGALVVDTGNSDALAAALGRVLADPELGEHLGGNARARVLDNWSWRHTAARTVEQYELLLDEYYATPPSKFAKPYPVQGELPEGAIKAQKMAAEARARAEAEER